MEKTFKKGKNHSVFWAFSLAFFGILFLLMLLLKKKTSVEEKSFEIVNEKVQKKEILANLNDRQIKSLNLLEQKGEITVEELMGKIKNVSERTFRRDMKKFEKLGFLKKEGNTKGSKYIFID